MIYELGLDIYDILLKTTTNHFATSNTKYCWYDLVVRTIGRKNEYCSNKTAKELPSTRQVLPFQTQMTSQI